MSAYFSVEALTPLSKLRAGARIHVIGVCGVAMAQMAIQLAKSGFSVSGSDKEFFEPMSSRLQASSVRCVQGYSADHLDGTVELVVIGNSVVATNPEVLETEKLKLAFSIFPKLLHELAIEGRHSIVVAGTHGKTTTTAICAYLLSEAGFQPSFFIGGRVRQLPGSLQVGTGNVSVVEGDEYDSAFFAKFAKFHFYAPNVLIVTAIEFDHADIYSNLDAIKSEFSKLAAAMPPDSTVIACTDDEGVRSMLEVFRRGARVIGYGIREDAEARITFSTEFGKIEALLSMPGGRSHSIKLAIPGRYNLFNAAAAILALEVSGYAITESLLQLLRDFKGVDRRQQVWLETPQVLVEDFAHHPTAVKETMAAMREWYQGRRLIAIFEPRSNTSRRKIFQSAYVDSFSAADIVVLKNVTSRALDDASDLFDVKVVVDKLVESGKKAFCFDSVDEIKDFVCGEVQEGDVVVVMSNGSFDGLIVKLKEGLGR